MNRINEITFNSSLLAEFRAIDFVTRLIDQGRLPRGTGPGEYRRINVHRIVLDATSADISTAGSKLIDRLRFLRDAAHAAASARRGTSSTSISTTSACAARSISRARPSAHRRESGVVLAATVPDAPAAVLCATLRG